MQSVNIDTARGARRWMWAMAAVAAGVAAGIFAPALSGRAFAFGTDTVSHDLIVLLYGWGRMQGEARVPLWCPHLYGGLPFVASFAFCPFYPSQWLFFALPFGVALGAQYGLALAVAAWGNGFWAQCQGVSRRGVLFAVVATAAVGHLLTLTYAGHLQKMIAIAWAPIVLAAAGELGRRHGARGRWSLGLGVAWAMQLLASHWQIAYATFWAAGAWALAAAAEASRRRPRRTAELAGTAAHFAAAALFGLLLAGIQMAPGLEMAGLSNRARGVDFAEATATSYPPRELWEFLIPRVFGDSVRGTQTPYLGFWGERLVSDYVGPGILMLALVGWLGGRSRTRWWLATMFALSVVLGLGHATPLYRGLYDWWPGFAQFRSPGTFMFLATLALVQLAAMGLDSLSAPADRRSAPLADPAVSGIASSETPNSDGPALRHRAWLGGGALVVMAWGVLAWLAPEASGRLLGIGTERQWQAHGTLLENRLRRAGCAASVACALTAMALLSGSARARRWALSLRRGGAPGGQVLFRGAASARIADCLALFAVADAFVANRHFLQFDPWSSYEDYLAKQPYVVCLREVAGRERWLACRGHEPERVLLENLLKNDPIVHGFATPAGYHPVVLGRYDRLVRRVGWENGVIARNYAVRWAIGSPSWRPPGGEDLWSEPRACGGVRLWRARLAMPYAWWARDWSVEASETEVACALTAKPASRAVLCQGDLPAGARRSLESAARLPAGAPIEPAEIVAYASGRISVRGPARAEGPALLIVAENYAPGWRARTSSGAPALTLAVNLAQLGVWQVQDRPSHPGQPFSANIELRYEPFSWRVGVFASFAALALLGTALAGRQDETRRRHQACATLLPESNEREGR